MPVENAAAACVAVSQDSRQTRSACTSPMPADPGEPSEYEIKSQKMHELTNTMIPASQPRLRGRGGASPRSGGVSARSGGSSARSGASQQRDALPSHVDRYRSVKDYEQRTKPAHIEHAPTCKEHCAALWLLLPESESTECGTGYDIVFVAREYSSGCCKHVYALLN